MSTIFKTITVMFLASSAVAACAMDLRFDLWKKSPETLSRDEFAIIRATLGNSALKNYVMEDVQHWAYVGLLFTKGQITKSSEVSMAREYIEKMPRLMRDNNMKVAVSLLEKNLDTILNKQNLTAIDVMHAWADIGLLFANGKDTSSYMARLLPKLPQARLPQDYERSVQQRQKASQVARDYMENLIAAHARPGAHEEKGEVSFDLSSFGDLNIKGRVVPSLHEPVLPGEQSCYGGYYALYNALCFSRDITERRLQRDGFVPFFRDGLEQIKKSGVRSPYANLRAAAMRDMFASDLPIIVVELNYINAMASIANITLERAFESRRDAEILQRFVAGSLPKIVVIAGMGFADNPKGHWIVICAERNSDASVSIEVADSSHPIEYYKDHKRVVHRILPFYLSLTRPVQDWPRVIGPVLRAIQKGQDVEGRQPHGQAREQEAIPAENPHHGAGSQKGVRTHEKGAERFSDKGRALPVQTLFMGKGQQQGREAGPREPREGSVEQESPDFRVAYEQKISALEAELSGVRQELARTMHEQRAAPSAAVAGAITRPSEAEFAALQDENERLKTLAEIADQAREKAFIQLDLLAQEKVKIERELNARRRHAESVEKAIKFERPDVSAVQESRLQEEARVLAERVRMLESQLRERPVQEARQAHHEEGSRAEVEHLTARVQELEGQLVEVGQATQQLMGALIGAFSEHITPEKMQEILTELGLGEEQESEGAPSAQ